MFYHRRRITRVNMSMVKQTATLPMAMPAIAPALRPLWHAGLGDITTSTDNDEAPYDGVADTVSHGSDEMAVTAANWPELDE